MEGVIYLLLEHEVDGSVHAGEGSDGRPLVYRSARLAEIFARVFSSAGRDVGVCPIDLRTETPNF